MRRWRYFGWFLTLVLFLGCGSATRIPPERLAVAPFDVTLPEAGEVRWQLANGLEVRFARNDELPLVRGALYLKGGGLQEQVGETGLADATGKMMRAGGAGQRAPEELDRALESLAASIGGSFASEYGSFTFQSLAADAPAVFGMFADVVLRPRFDTQRLAVWKAQALDEIRRRKDDSMTVAQLAFMQLLYQGSQYGRVLVSADVERIRPELLRRMHERLVQPDRAVLVIVGAVDEVEVRSMVAREFGAWRATRALDLTPPPLTATPAQGIYHVALPFQQSAIVIGQLGVPRLTPDHVAIDVFNEAFGSGGFGSQLMMEVRTRRGLAYGVQGLMLQRVVKGPNLITLSTKRESTVDAIVASLGVLKQMQTELLSDALVGEHQQSIANSFIFAFESPMDIVQRSVSQRFLGYPLDYDRTYLRRVHAVTPADIQRVASSYWNVKECVVVVVGDPAVRGALESMRSAHPELFGSMPLMEAQFDEQLKRS